MWRRNAGSGICTESAFSSQVDDFQVAHYPTPIQGDMVGRAQMTSHKPASGSQQTPVSESSKKFGGNWWIARVVEAGMPRILDWEHVRFTCPRKWALFCKPDHDKGQFRCKRMEMKLNAN